MYKKVIIRICLGIFIWSFYTYACSQQVRTINILHADSLVFLKVPGQADIQKLIRNVSFSDSSAIMYCDSAYYYSSNKIDAFSHIRIVQTSGALNISSEILNYDGSKKLAELHKNVVLNDEDISLRTKAVFYDMRAAVASYNDSAHIVNKQTIITSKKGQYYKLDRSIHFQKDVIIIDPQYRIYSDTVNYGTVSKITEFYGPTHIITDKDSIYCERGWYNTQNENSYLYKNPFIISEGRRITADTLTYLKSTGYGRAVHHVEIVDTAQNAVIKGNYALYNPDTKSATVTDSALLIQISEGDSLFVHADTIRSQKDSTEKYNILKAYYKVRLFRKDLSGKCDSLVYSSVDSTLQFHGTPVLWSDSSQLTADYIQMFMVDKKINRLELKNSAFLISQDDSTKFSQIKGKTMTGYFEDSKLYKLVVKGNGQTIHFPKDKEEYIGMNKTSSSDVVIFMKDSKIQDILLLVKPEGSLVPLKEVHKEDMYLKDFLWQEDKKPKRKEDIFIWK